MGPNRAFNAEWKPFLALKWLSSKEIMQKPIVQNILGSSDHEFTWLNSRINDALPAGDGGGTWAHSEWAVPGAAKASIAAERVYCGCFAAYLCPDCFTWLFCSKISVLYPVCQCEALYVGTNTYQLSSGYISWYLLESHFIFSEPAQPSSAFPLFFLVLATCAEPLVSSWRITYFCTMCNVSFPRADNSTF